MAISVHESSVFFTLIVNITSLKIELTKLQLKPAHRTSQQNLDIAVFKRLSLSLIAHDPLLINILPKFKRAFTEKELRFTRNVILKVFTLYLYIIRQKIRFKQLELHLRRGEPTLESAKTDDWYLTVYFTLERTDLGLRMDWYQNSLMCLH